ncbi:MAG: hypothetical protein WDN26_14045 [Chitinophagaceae bacterium]
MKNLLIIFFLILLSNSIFPQWSTTGSDIYNSNSGRVGIGTGGPTAKLTVVASTSNDGIWLSGTATTNIALLNNVGTGSWNPLSQSGDNLLLWKGSTIDNVDAGGLVLAPWSNGNNGVRISSFGNVGIGTSPNTNAKLDVNGNIFSNGKIVIGTTDMTKVSTYSLAVNGDAIFNRVKVELHTSWPDFVFKRSYNLLPLKDLEKYIQLNNHLPEIPTETEVGKNGIDLGEMNAKLLQKIEELTLYVIELKKENEQIKKDVQKISSIKNSSAAQ